MNHISQRPLIMTIFIFRKCAIELGICKIRTQTNQVEETTTQENQTTYIV